MTLMNYQNLDTNLEYYFKFFASSAFVLKPTALRYVPVGIPPPKPQDKAVDYKPRDISMPQFSLIFKSQYIECLQGAMLFLIPHKTKHQWVYRVVFHEWTVQCDCNWRRLMWKGNAVH